MRTPREWLRTGGAKPTAGALLLILIIVQLVLSAHLSK
jgi:hypothetical protein